MGSTTSRPSIVCEIELVTSLASTCDNMHGLLPVGEAQLSPMYRVFILRLRYIDVID